MCPNVHSKEFVLSKGSVSVVHVQHAYLVAYHQFALYNIGYILNTWLHKFHFNITRHASISIKYFAIKIKRIDFYNVLTQLSSLMCWHKPQVFFLHLVTLLTPCKEASDGNFAFVKSFFKWIWKNGSFRNIDNLHY